MSWYFSSKVGVGSHKVRILSELNIKISSLVISNSHGSKIVYPDSVLITKGLTNLQSGAPGTAAGTSSTSLIRRF